MKGSPVVIDGHSYRWTYTGPYPINSGVLLEEVARMESMDEQSLEKSAFRMKRVLNRTGVPSKPSAELARVTVIRDKGVGTRYRASCGRVDETRQTTIESVSFPKTNGRPSSR